MHTGPELRAAGPYPFLPFAGQLSKGAQVEQELLEGPHAALLPTSQPRASSTTATGPRSHR